MNVSACHTTTMNMFSPIFSQFSNKNQAKSFRKLILIISYGKFTIQFPYLMHYIGITNFEICIKKLTYKNMEKISNIDLHIL